MTRLRWVVSAVAVLAALLITTPAQAQVAEEPRWEYVRGYAFADVYWTLAGRIDGRPGNAHSGYFYVEDVADGALVEQYDWRCPAGVVPPLGPSETTSCVLKAVLSGEQSDGVDGADFAPYLIRNQVQVSVPVEDSLTGDVVDQTVDVKIRGLDDLVRTVDRYSVDGEDGLRYRYKDVTLTRTPVFAGSVAWLDFADPRLVIASSTLSRYSTYVKLPGTPPPS